MVELAVQNILTIYEYLPMSAAAADLTYEWHYPTNLIWHDTNIVTLSKLITFTSEDFTMKLNWQ